MIARRSFVKAAALGALSGSTFVFPAKSFAAEDEFPSTEIEFTEEIAASMGLNFAKSMNLGEGLRLMELRSFTIHRCGPLAMKSPFPTKRDRSDTWFSILD